MQIYGNTPKNREIDKGAAKVLHPRKSSFARKQSVSNRTKSAARPVLSNTHFSGCFSIDSKPQKISFECSSLDKQHIADLISTLDNASLMTLGLKAPRLISIGNTLDHIHPLLFIHVAMTDDDLRARIKRIFTNSIKRIVFMNGNGIAEGFGHRLNRESSKKNLEPHLKDFAETLHVPVPFLVELVRKRAWNDLFLQLCEKIDGPSEQRSQE